MLHSNRIVLPVLLFVLLLACAGPGVKPESAKGIYHVVKRGETLWSISRAYHVSLQEIAEINNITNAAAIEAGHVIFIPGAEKTIDRIPVPEQREATKKPPDPKEPSKKAVAQREPVKKKPARAIKTAPMPPQKVQAEPEHQATVQKPEKAEEPEARKPAEAAKQAETSKHPETETRKTEPQKIEDVPGQDRIEFDRQRFIWPVKGSIISKYGIQPNGLKHNGIRIGAKDGTPVLAAASGEVTYSDTLKYYGETIIVKHDENFSTVYTSLKARGVRSGDRIKKGERIAAVGKSDSNGQPALTFEIRQMNKPRNPLFFLP